MSDTYILYNPFSGGGQGRPAAEHLKNTLGYGILQNMTEIEDYKVFFAPLGGDDVAIICGGDGTLNRFVNETDGIDIACDIRYYGAGSGNDFMKDIGKTANDGPFSVKRILSRLPVITVNGVRRKFFNGTGLGLDGYCCDQVKKARESGSKVNYIIIALQGLLWKYTPHKAVVTVDGETMEYSRVWLATTMFGRYFGGGVMAAPEQDRNNEAGTSTLAVMCNVSRLRALTIFPTLMNGTHLKYKKIVHMHPGHKIHVKLDKPVILQIDGETFENVSEYDIES